MNKALLYFTCFIIAISATTFEAHSQRTAKGQLLFSGSFDYNLSSIGGELSVGQYLHFGYWAAGINFQNRAYSINGINNKANFQQLEPMGVFMYRILKTPSRFLNLYAGADAFIGAEFMDMFASLPKTVLNAMVNKGYQYTRFIYGGGLRIEGEYFPLPQLAIILPFRLSITGNTAMKETVGFSVGIGVRYNL